MAYQIQFHEGWDAYFSKLDTAMKKRVVNKILQHCEPIPARHLKKGAPFFVSEIGQYKLCYEIDAQASRLVRQDKQIDEEKKTKMVYFVGTHKEYEKWLGYF
ncbi:hypothetical protein COV61_00145 [Candidatus Micrarchaeota archaeon CG11_big_fil_rev_8_21_14_0_20_47_5]|nr:MAG: hypothetical protein AUJ17_05260 [Candidatus Micrarchaeota archaeon CG1_02_47_40]PIN84437.1 MAG: hypothetical protein COV61_00145 [Candidatus Micrarchaeota archaeon CG11_big_fil_rev_8_21_14_0_20_47_5]